MPRHTHFASRSSVVRIAILAGSCLVGSCAKQSTQPPQQAPGYGPPPGYGDYRTPNGQQPNGQQPYGQQPYGQAQPSYPQTPPYGGPQGPYPPPSGPPAPAPPP